MTITLSIDLDKNLIMGALETPDDIGKIVRCHLAIEQMLEELITTHSQASIDKKASFWSKVNLARAMGVPTAICDACSYLNDLRNALAHNSKATISNTKSISEKFVSKVAEIVPALLKSNGTFHNQKTKITHTLKFTTATLSEKIVVAASFLAALMGSLPSMYKFGPPPKLVIVAGVNL